MTQVFETGQRVRDKNELHNRGPGTVLRINQADGDLADTGLYYTVRWDSGREDQVVYPTELEPAAPARPAGQ